MTGTKIIIKIVILHLYINLSQCIFWLVPNKFPSSLPTCRIGSRLKKCFIKVSWIGFRQIYNIYTIKLCYTSVLPKYQRSTIDLDIWVYTNTVCMYNNLVSEHYIVSNIVLHHLNINLNNNKKLVVFSLLWSICLVKRGKSCWLLTIISLASKRI